MKAEAERHNNPDGFAMFGKLNRQIVKKEKTLAELKKKAEKSRTQLPPMEIIKEASRETDRTEESELFFEEEKKTVDSPLPVQPPMVIPKINVSKDAPEM